MTPPIFLMGEIIIIIIKSLACVVLVHGTQNRTWRTKVEGTKAVTDSHNKCKERIKIKIKII